MSSHINDYPGPEESRRKDQTPPTPPAPGQGYASPGFTAGISHGPGEGVTYSPGTPGGSHPLDRDRLGPNGSGSHPV